MSQKKALIWLEDNPTILTEQTKFLSSLKVDIDKNFDLYLWDGKYDIKENRGTKCLETFMAHINNFINSPTNVAGFIIDIRIPVRDLSILGLSHIETRQGLITGEQVAYYYLRNADNNATLGNKFKNTPILLLSVASKIESAHLKNDKKISYLCKTKENAIEEVKIWLKNL